MNKPQREMPFYQALTPPKWAPEYVIDSFTGYRDAVIWCWENRRNTGAGENVDQALCANLLGIYAPHFSRYVKRDSSAPMKLDPDFYPAFEAFTGWNAITQWIGSKKQVTFMEQVQEMMKSRASRTGAQQCA